MQHTSAPGHAANEPAPLHRVVVGLYLDADAAKAQRARLAKDGIESAVAIEHL